MFIWSALAVRTLMASPPGTVAGPTSFSGHQHDAMGTSDALDQRCSYYVTLQDPFRPVRRGVTVVSASEY